MTDNEKTIANYNFREHLNSLIDNSGSCINKYHHCLCHTVCIINKHENNFCATDLEFFTINDLYDKRFQLAKDILSKYNIKNKFKYILNNK